MNPCNAGIGSLADRAVAAVKAAGGMPQTWGFPTGSDGISMGTEGMRYSLPSREEIARCIQIGWGSHQMDGLMAIAGCDKNKPGCLMGIAYCNVPSVYVDAAAHGRGIGRALLARLIEESERRGFRQMVAVIGDNVPASIALHASLGFVHAGRLTAVGFKFGRWCDSTLMQRALGPGDGSPP